MKEGKDWFPNDKATHEWLDSYKKGSRATYQTGWKYFLEYTGMTGDQILADRKQDKDYKWEQKVLDFKQWMKDEKNQSDYSATTAAATARSFFSFHRLPLQFRRTESSRLSEAKRKHEDYRFSVEDLKKMADVGDLTEKYVVVVGKSFGLRAGDFLRLTRGDLEAYIDREPPISIGEYSTEKESVSAFPFIDSDAKPIIKLKLESMNRDKRTNSEDRMLTYKDSIQLTRTLKRVADKAGIQHGNKRVRFHCLRKFLIDRLSSFMSESKWKQIVGKTITEGAYVSPDSLREDYKRAMSTTCFSKAVGTEEIQLLAKKEALMMLAKMQGMTEEDTKRIFRQRKVTNLKEEVEALEQSIESQKANSNNCANGEHCQRIVDESELPQLLSEGWEVRIVLPSGKLVVEK